MRIFYFKKLGLPRVEKIKPAPNKYQCKIFTKYGNYILPGMPIKAMLVYALYG